jgi:TPR repeat protein
MKTKVVRIDFKPASPAYNHNFSKTPKPLLYIVYLLTLLFPLGDAGASPETDFSDGMAKASAGDAASQQKVGDAYCKGVGVKQNFAEAFAWLSKASEQNDIQAQKDIGHLFSKGLGVVKDETAAFNWYMKAAQLNDPGGNAHGRCTLPDGPRGGCQ